MGLPVLRLSSSSTHAVTNTPAEPQAAFRSHSPVTTAFPVLSPGRLPHHSFRGLLSVHSHYGLRGRQVPYRTLYTRGFSRFVTSTTAPVATGRSESCRTGFAPAERQRLCTAHDKIELVGLRRTSGCPVERRPSGPPASGNHLFSPGEGVSVERRPVCRLSAIAATAVVRAVRSPFGVRFPAMDPRLRNAARTVLICPVMVREPGKPGKPGKPGCPGMLPAGLT